MAEDVVAADVAAPLVVAAAVEAVDAVDVTLALEVTVAEDVFVTPAETLDVVALAVVVAAELGAALLVAEDDDMAGTAVSVGGAVVPLAPVLQAASNATPLTAPSWANSCRQRRRPMDGRND